MSILFNTRIVFVHPNYQSGGAEIAGNWPPAWVAYLAGPCARRGYDDIHFIDAMTNSLDDEAIFGRCLRELQPDMIGVTGITPAIYAAERLLEIAREECPNAVRVLGGIHATFMFKQVLSEAPWIDVIVRGEGEEITLNLVRAIDEGRWPNERDQVKGIAFLGDDGAVVATPAEPSIKDIDTIKPDWGMLEWKKYIYIPLGVPVATRTWPAAAPSPAPSARSGSSGATTACATRKDGRRDRGAGEGPRRRLLHPRRRGAHHQPQAKFIEFCQELIDRDLGIQVGHQHPRHGRHARRGPAALLPQGRPGARLARHRGRGAAEPRPLRQGDHGRPEQARHPAAAANGIVTEAQFIVGLENETRETLEETYQMVMDWGADMANWSMYTPWPFSDMFTELGDKVEVFDYSKYNFVSPIMKPDNIDRAELLDGVMANYRRFYMKRRCSSTPG
jgi:anaerobic magnesium-protoporphyrin IX monomethyl ester cyclase